jgi:S1-C subfamily serine protease
VLASDSGWSRDTPILVDPIVWERVFTEVSRSGSMVTLSGVVTGIGVSVVGYAPHGSVTDLSGIVLTDMILSPWDSGAPIYNSERELIDLVHIK